MALPESGPLSGSQIATELGLGFTYLSLSGMYATSSLSGTTPLEYSGFWGYSNDPIRSLAYRYGSTVGKPVLVCENDYGYAVSVYYNGVFSIQIGDYCYTAETGDSVLANGNYAIGSGLSNPPLYVITISNGTGYVSARLDCWE
jgi:hypothetical protein